MQFLLMKRGVRVIYAGSLRYHSQISTTLSLLQGFQISRMDTLLQRVLDLRVSSTVIYRNIDVYFRRTQELIKELSTPPPESKVLYFQTRVLRSERLLMV